HQQHSIEVGDGVTDQRLIGLTNTLAVIGLFEPPAHSGQRGPQVVRNVVAYLLDLAHQCFDAVQHQVEVLCNAIPFVIGAAERDPLGQIAQHDGPAGGVDRFDPVYRSARHED